MQISIVNSSQLPKYDFGNFLWAPDFYQKDKLTLWNSLQSKSSNNLGYYFQHVKEVVRSISGEAICYDLTDGLTKFFDEGTRTNHIGSAKKIALEGDFAIARLRSYLEEMGLIEQKGEVQLFSTEYLIFRQIKELSSHTLFALCMTKHMQTILNRSRYGTEHPRFYEFVLEKFPIPDSILPIDAHISRIITSALETRKLSRKIYQESEVLLLSELGLIHWQPKHRLTFVKNYSNTESAERIDAEYYQPKYEEIVKAIQNYPGGWDALGNLVDIKKCIEVGSGEYLDKGMPFVRVSNLSSFDITEEKYISRKLYQTIEQHQPEKGEILFSKDATPGIAYYLNDTPRKMIPSSGILRLKSKTDKVNNEYLTLVLNSLLTKQQIERDVGGSIILHWRPDQVKQTAIPVLSKTKQLEIQRKITKSLRLRNESKQLLENAKHATEIAIEKDEQAAIEWLENANHMPESEESC